MTTVWACVKCGWVYYDTPGMGIHRVPIECPKCGGKILGKRVDDAAARLGER